MALMADIPLPLDLPEPETAPPCWYCGTSDARMETEHDVFTGCAPE